MMHTLIIVFSIYSEWLANTMWIFVKNMCFTSNSWMRLLVDNFTRRPSCINVFEFGRLNFQGCLNELISFEVPLIWLPNFRILQSDCWILGSLRLISQFYESFNLIGRDSDKWKFKEKIRPRIRIAGYR